MRRRHFLKAVLAVPAATALPLTALTAQMVTVPLTRHEKRIVSMANFTIRSPRWQVVLYGITD